MATQTLRFENIKPPPRDADFRDPCGGYFDMLSFKADTAIAADNDDIQLFLRMPSDEFWLIRQFRVYNNNSDPFDNVAIEIHRQGRQNHLTSGGQWAAFAGLPPTFNLFYSSTGGSGSVTFGINASGWKQPVYLGPNQLFELRQKVNKVGGWAANIIFWDFFVTRYPELGQASVTPEEIAARSVTTPLEGWYP